MEIQLADDVRAELMRLLHEERDKDRALLERLVAHLTVPPRSTWRVVELAGDGTPHDVPLEFPAQVVYIDNGSTKSVQVRAPGDIAQSPPIAASGQGRWLIPGATQVTVTGTGAGQVRLRFLNDAAARLLADNPPGGSTTSPVYASLTGSLAPLPFVDTLIVNTATVVAAGATYNSPAQNLGGYRQVGAVVNDVTGTSLSYSLWIFNQAPNSGKSLSPSSITGQTGTNAVLTNSFPTSDTVIAVINGNSTDSLTFTQLEVYAQ